jgi:hypothetical protein
VVFEAGESDLGPDLDDSASFAAILDCLDGDAGHRGRGTDGSPSAMG